MTVAHKNLTGVNLHEPKGAATAVSGAVYVADGAGSGTWTILDIPEGTFTIQQRLYTAAGTSTWNKPADLMFVRVYCQGGGEGTSGAGGTSSFGSHVTATGGSVAVQSTGDINSAYFDYLAWARNNAHSALEDAGNWAVKTITEASLGASETVTVGADGGGDSNAGTVFVEEYILI